MKLNLFANIKNLEDQKMHPKAYLLKNNFQFTSEKKMLLDWTDGLLDRDNKFIREFQETFHSSFWEIYLYKLFIEAGFELDQSHQMPDFIIKEPQEVYVEAVTANIRTGGTPEGERTIDDQLSMIIPPYLQTDFYQVLNEGIIRSANAIKGKHKKFVKEYINREWVKESNPFVIAIGSFDQINYGREFIYSMVALLYGMYFNAEQEAYYEKMAIEKPQTGSSIPIGIFRDSSYEEISAVVFSCTLTLGKLTSLCISNGALSLNDVYNIRQNCDTNKYLLQVVDTSCPEDIADGVFVFHNPKAKNKLPENFFKKIAVTQFFFEDGNLMYSGNVTPIVARLNTGKMFKSVIFSEIQEALRKYNRMNIEDFYE
ncbi:putative uncharacterized protein [Clostridium sp. CAG:81]|nr:putative uncharacterized protein [Clostridium sp. CAG:81]